MVGTENSETTVGSMDDNSVISPTNIDVQTHTYFGSENIQAVVTADLIFFVQGQGKRVRSTQYDFATDQYLSSELSLLASHITQAGIKEMSYRRHPFSNIFFVLNDGKAVSFTYERDNDVKGWSRIDISEGSIISAASNYSEKGDIIAGIMKRSEDYFLEVFQENRPDTLYVDGQLECDDDDFIFVGGSGYFRVLPFSTVNMQTVKLIKNGVDLPIIGYDPETVNFEGATIYFDDTTFTPGQWVVFVSPVDYDPSDIYTVGFEFESEISPTDVTDIIPTGLTKRSTKLALYLNDSGDCEIEVNGRDTQFTDGHNLSSGETLTGAFDVSANSGYDGSISLKLTTKNIKPFNILGVGYHIT